MTIFVCLIITKPLSCYAFGRFNPNQIDLEYSDAPEGTAYIDLLAKIKEDDESYTDFNISPGRFVRKEVVNGNTESVYEKLPIDKNSEIAKYCENGYVSLSIHSKDIESFKIYRDIHGYDALEIKYHTADFYSKYKKFKIAYVGENGEVLKITSKAGKRYSNFSKPNAFVANGKRAVFRSSGLSPVTVMIFFIIVFLIVVMPIVFILKKIIDKTEDKKMIERIKNEKK